MRSESSPPICRPRAMPSPRARTTRSSPILALFPPAGTRLGYAVSEPGSWKTAALVAVAVRIAPVPPTEATSVRPETVDAGDYSPKPAPCASPESLARGRLAGLRLDPLDEAALAVDVAEDVARVLGRQPAFEVGVGGRVGGMGAEPVAEGKVPALPLALGLAEMDVHLSVPAV